MATLTLQPSAGIDTFLYEGSPTFNYGSAIRISVGLAGGINHRGLLQFDLSSVPTKVRITAATLVLHAYNVTSSAVAETIGVYRSRIEWFEGNVDNTTLGAGVNGSTWNLRNNNGSLSWTGADWEAATSTQVVQNIGDYSFDVTNDIQAWVYGTAPNYGWFILASGLASGAKTFASSDNATAGNRPELIITYDVLPDNDTVTFQPSGPVSSDTYIDSTATSLNYGVTTNLAVLGDGVNPSRKMLIKFGELYTLPPNIDIASATLRLRCSSGGAAQNVTVHRGLTEWFGGYRGASAALFNEPNWTYRNAIATTAWSASGGQAGTDYATTPTATTSVTSGAAFYDWDVTADVQDIVDGVIPNRGWWLLTTGTLQKLFSSAETATAANRPQLIITYVVPTVAGSTSGTATVTGTLMGVAGLSGSTAGTSVATAILISNEFSRGSTAGTSTVSGFLSARTFISGNAFGDSTASADIKASYRSQASAAGTSSHVANIKGIFRMQGSASGQGTLVATPSFQGQLRGTASGSTSTEAVGYARAVGKATEVGCNPVPLFYITDGSVKENGQLNILNFLGERNGYLLKNYRPPINQYKDGGRWSSSPQSQGRRFQGRQFDNAIDILELSLTAFDQDTVIDFQQELLAFQEAAADYWSSEYPLLPIYLVARAARERNTRYAIIHMISCPELENPYAQPFFSHQGAAFENLTVRIERGLWWSTPPGRLDCVETSGQREWTVSGWQAGS